MRQNHKLFDINTDTLDATCPTCGVAKAYAEVRKNKIYYRCEKRKRDIFLEWSHRNKEYDIFRASEWKKNNAEHVRKYRAAYYAANREQQLAKNAEWYKNHPERVSSKNSIRRIRFEHGMTAEDIRLSENYRSTIKDDSCYWCGSDNGPKHFDHLVPLAKGGTDHWFNLVRSCANCNQRKHAMMPGEFLSKLKGGG